MTTTTPDLILGMRNIAARIGRSAPAGYHLARIDPDFPVLYIGGRLCARPAALEAYVLLKERQARSARLARLSAPSAGAPDTDPQPQPQQQPAKRGRGRPKGRTNKKKVTS